jgi:hypothetical protein
MKSYILTAFLILLPLCGNGSNDSPIKVNIIYDEPVSGYNVTGVFYPFDSKSETGQIELRFTPVNGGRTLVYSNVGKHEAGHPEWPQKFTGRNIYAIVFNDNFKGFKDGETLHWYYHSAQSSFWRESPLLYDAEFQFYDVDFDGQMELLINDYEKARYGNGYSVFEITPGGLVQKKGKPFDSITNLTEFFPETRIIIDYLYDDTDSKCEYTITKDGNSVVKTVKVE